MNQEMTQQISSLDNNPFSNSFMEIRLNTDKLLKRIEMFLTSRRTTYNLNHQTGQYEEHSFSFGSPMANPQGVNAILKLVDMTANEQTVQGNFTREDFEDYKYYCRREFAKIIVKNAPRWGILDSDLDTIIDGLMRLIWPFMSRLIDNKERESYMQQFKSTEIIKDDPATQSRGLSSIFGGRSGA